jgi:hypothetical protein
VGGRRGREIRRRARVRTRRSTASAEGAELTRRPTAQRDKKGACGATTRQLAIWARETKRDKGSARVKETSADRSVPLGSEQEREGTCEGELSLIGGSACQTARACGLAGLSGLLSLFLFL